jgi:rubrerythrin
MHKTEQAHTIDWRTISLEEILRLAIADEVEARDYYKHAAELAGNPHTRTLLLQLSVMEQGHADQLSRELEELLLQREEESGIAD